MGVDDVEESISDQWLCRRGKRRPAWYRQRLSVRRCQLDGALAGRRYRQLALRSQSPAASFRFGPPRPDGSPVLGWIDDAAGQGRSGYRHRSAGVTTDGGQRFRLLWLESVLGHGLLHGWLRLYGSRHGIASLGVEAARGGNCRLATQPRRSASAQHRSGHRLPYPCQRRRNRSRRGLLHRGYRLEHPSPHRRYQELVARQDGADLATIGIRDRLDQSASEPRGRSPDGQRQPSIRYDNGRSRLGKTLLYLLGPSPAERSAVIGHCLTRNEPHTSTSAGF